MGEVIVQGIQL